MLRQRHATCLWSHNCARTSHLIIYNHHLGVHIDLEAPVLLCRLVGGACWRALGRLILPLLLSLSVACRVIQLEAELRAWPLKWLCLLSSDLLQWSIVRRCAGEQELNAKRVNRHT